MPIKYALYKNPLTDNPDDRRAIVQQQRTRSLDDLIEYMTRSGTTVGRADALAVIEMYHTAIQHFISRGDRIDT